MKIKKTYQRIIIITSITAIILGMGLSALTLANKGKIALGVKAAGLNLGRTSPPTAQEKLNQAWDNFNQEQITLASNEKTWLIKLNDLGFQIDSAAVINQAYQIGRSIGNAIPNKVGNRIPNLKEQISALLGRYNLELIYQIDQEKFEQKTQELFHDIERPVQNASLYFDEQADDFLLIHSHQGISINRDRLLLDLSKRIKIFSAEPVNLEMILEEPVIKNNQVDSARQKAQEILANQPYQLFFPEQDKSWLIDKKLLIDWIIFGNAIPNKVGNRIPKNSDQALTLSLDQEKIKTYLVKISKSIDQPTANAQLETHENKAVVFNPGQTGFQVQKEKTIEQLRTSILAEPAIKKTMLFTHQALPEIPLSQTNDLGINTLISQGESDFSGSPKNRIHNIKTGTAKLNGLILNPGQEFSFNNLLGESGPDQGYLPELVIKNKKTIPEYGGGLCQVSTTIFRAAVRSGMEVIQRSPHAFPVVYYNPPGFDATVYTPQPDLRFINNTANHLLIQGIVKGNKLFFNFYGTDDGRKVKVIGPTILEKKENGAMKTLLKQEVYQNNELIYEKEFYSNYQSPDLFQ